MPVQFTSPIPKAYAANNAQKTQYTPKFGNTSEANETAPPVTEAAEAPPTGILGKITHFFKQLFKIGTIAIGAYTAIKTVFNSIRNLFGGKATAAPEEA